jgi:hypothetical protein
MRNIRQLFVQAANSVASLLSVSRSLFPDGLYDVLNGVVDSDPYIPNGNGAQWYINQNNMQVSIFIAEFLYCLIRPPPPVH